MSLYSRLSVRFLLQMAGLLLIVWCIVGGVLVWYGIRNRPAGPSTGPSPAAIMERMPAATTVQDGRVTVDGSTLADVRRTGGWLQVLDDSGSVIYSFRAPSGLPTKYAPGLLVYDRLNPQAFGYRLATWYAVVDRQSLTWLYGSPLGADGAASAPRPRPYVYALGLLVASLVATVLSGALFGRQLGRPLLHMMDWLQNLARGAYEEPADRRGVPRSRTAAGELRRPYRVYREVLSALERLEESLKEGVHDRERLERTREEWITGVTHDLRTPLSSVRGYADMFVAPSYTWSAEEVRRFGRVIADKAAYMDSLIEDLGLTFRLRNRALPLQPAPVNVVELARDVVIDVVNALPAGGQAVEFESDAEEVVYPLDRRWFNRALENLVTNASLHNPPDTTITVRIEALGTPDASRYAGVRLRIQDDGAGMDPETVERLFDRYYRGADTGEAHAKGSGLGTAIARQLIEAHGGRVSVDSALGQGTVVTIELPPRQRSAPVGSPQR